MFVLQNGLNTVTGDPRLDAERGLQVDVGWRLDNGRFRGRIGGFHSWVWGHITFENMAIVRGPPSGQIEQEQLKYVNTGLATYLGGELAGEYDWNDWLTPFATLSYVDGRDRTRNGAFATSPSAPGQPSERWWGLSRGAFSGITGAAEEPLPGISPLESRLGFRLHQPGTSPRWSVELSARVVDRQDRVATSLLETPTPGFAVWDVRSYWQATDRWLLIAGIENFTDRNYREHLDFRSQSGIQMFQPGITSYFGSEVTY
jgi:outer membrane receptor protein involved in Fe transport